MSVDVAGQARSLIRTADGRALTERESTAVLALYGIRTPRAILAPSFEQAVEAAEAIGYPVLVKAESTAPGLPSEPDPATLNIGDEVALKRGFKRALAGAWATVPWDSIAGIVVQEMLAPGTAMTIGLRMHPQRGPVAMLGLAGVPGAAPQDVQMLPLPCSDAEARAVLVRLPANVDALVDVLVRFSEVCADLRDLVHQIDLTVLVNLDSGKDGCVVRCAIVPFG